MKRPLKLYDMNGKRIKNGDNVSDTYVADSIYKIEKIERRLTTGGELVLNVKFGKAVGRYDYSPETKDGKFGVHLRRLRLV